MTEVVYVIGSPDSSVVKIGFSSDVKRRLADIQRMSPVRLAVLWQTEGGLALEQRLHQIFGQLRSHGEWFDFADVDPVAEVSYAVADMQIATEEAEEALQGLQAATAAFGKAEEVARAAVLAAIDAGFPHPVVADASPFTLVEVRQADAEREAARAKNRAGFSIEELQEQAMLLPQQRKEELIEKLQREHPDWYNRTTARLDRLDQLTATDPRR